MELQRISPKPRMSAAVVHGDTVYTAGHVDNSATDVAGQTRAILARLDAVLAEAGTDNSRLISANIWLADIATFGEMNGVWDAWIDPGNAPARATVEARLASPEYKVEIAFIAAR